MLYIEETSCCGVNEFSGLERPLKTLKQYCKGLFHKEYDYFTGTEVCDPEYQHAFILITDRTERTRGVDLVKYIKKHKLGYTVHTRAKKNPNSGNKIRAWLWSPDNRALRAWYKKHK